MILQQKKQEKTPNMCPQQRNKAIYYTVLFKQQLISEAPQEIAKGMYEKLPISALTELGIV